MPNRPAIPAETQRKILTECGHRRAVCGERCYLDKAHIIPWKKTKDHRAENLICLCPNCHDQADREEWGEKTLQEYKKEPWVLRRFGKPETTKQTSGILLAIEKTNDGEAFSENDRLWILSALTGFLQISPYDLKIRRVEEGSIKLTIELPSEDADWLLKHYGNVTPQPGAIPRSISTGRSASRISLRIYPEHLSL